MIVFGTIANLFVWIRLMFLMRDLARNRRPPRPPRTPSHRPPYGLDHYVPPNKPRDYQSVLILPIVVFCPMNELQPKEEPALWTSRPAIEGTYKQLEVRQ